MDKIAFYDPAIDAYREISIEAARSFVESAKKVEAKLAELDAQNNATPAA